MHIRRDRQSPEQVERILRSRLESKLLKLRRIEEPTGCWLFIGHIESNGYGRTSYKSKNYSVHQLSAYLYLGYILGSSLQVNHKRECPNKHFFNYEHLYVGNQKANMEDRVSKLVELPCGHSKTNLYIYTSHDGKIYKWCRQCKREARHKYWIEKGK